MFNKKYSYEEAKTLYKKLIKEVDEDTKKHIRDDLITGTLYVAKEYVDNNPIITKNSTDLEDIYNTSYNAWILFIDNGNLLKIKNFNDYTYFEKTFHRLLKRDFSPNDVINNNSTETFSNISNDTVDPNKIFSDEIIDKETLKHIVTEALERDGLDEQEKHVLIEMFGLDGNKEKTLREIANEYNLTYERIRQIGIDAINKIKKRYNAIQNRELGLNRNNKKINTESVTIRAQKDNHLIIKYESPKILETDNIVVNKRKELNHENILFPKEAIKKLETIDDIKKFISDRLVYLQNTTMHRNSDNIWSDFVYEAYNTPFYIGYTGMQTLLNIDNTYIRLLKQIVDRKKGIVELYLFEDLFYILNGYKEELNSNDILVFNPDGKAILAHNFFKIIGLDSSVVLGNKNGLKHAFVLLYLNGYDNKDVVLYDPTTSLVFENKNNDKLYMGAFKVLLKSDYERLINNDDVIIDFGQSGKIYKQNYDALDGYELNLFSINYGIRPPEVSETKREII